MNCEIARRTYWREPVGAGNVPILRSDRAEDADGCVDVSRSITHSAGLRAIDETFERVFAALRSVAFGLRQGSRRGHSYRHVRCIHRTSRALGIELYRGSMAYLEPVNRRGGIHGKKIVIRADDDGYDPTPAIRNTIKLVDDDDVFLLVNYVGTPTVTRVLPLLKNYRKKHVYLFFPFTGAQPQRQPPYSDFVFNLRASYQNETEGLVDHFVRVGRTKIAIFYQADAYGRGGWEGVKDALGRHGLRSTARPPIVEVRNFRQV